MSEETTRSVQGYDAAAESTVRSMLIFPTNSRKEFNRTMRSRMQEKARSLEGNFAVSGRIRSKFGRCVAGKGIMPEPVTRDPDFNKAAKAWFMEWASNPRAYAIDASRDLWEDQCLVAEELGGGDGEFFEALVMKDGRPMVQPLDPFEIGTPWGSGSLNPRIYDDGVRADQYLRPLGYSVRELASPLPGAKPNTFRDVPATQMIHLFRRRRAKQFRGIPPLYAGLNDGNDAMDILALEKATDKLHAVLAVAKVVKAQNKGKGLSDQVKAALDATGNATEWTENFPRGAATVELDEGEDLRLLTSGRPGTAAIEGAKFYCALLTLAGDLPFSVIWSFAGLGGAPTRADMEDAQSTFEKRQDQIVWRQSQRIYTYGLAFAQDTGAIPRCRDPYWWASDWHGPAKITVDYGRSAQANIDLTRNGLMSHLRYYEERGANAYDEMRKQIEFLKWLRAECEAAGVPIEMIIEPTPGAVTNVNVQNPESNP